MPSPRPLRLFIVVWVMCSLVVAYEPCSIGSGKGQTTDNDCNPACFLRWNSANRYCSSYTDGWVGLKEVFTGNCWKMKSDLTIQICGCHSKVRGDVCDCQSNTMDKLYCWKSTEACPALSNCQAGQQPNQGCGCNLRSDGSSYECSTGQSAGCSNCPTGTYQPDAQSIRPCVAYSAVEPGFYIDDASTASNTADFQHRPCEDGWACTGGHYQNARKYICPVGTYSQGGKSACDLCPLGKACLVEGSTMATYIKCNAQPFFPMQDTTGARLCTDFLNAAEYLGSRNYIYYVAAGFKLAMQETGEWAWRPCDAGTSSTMRMDANAHTLTGCTACAPGQYSNTEGQSACKLCPMGSYRSSSSTSATGCEWCADGTTSRILGATSCQPCPRGTYKTYSQLGTWDENKQPESQYCSDCAAGTFAAQVGASACTPAASGFFVPNTQATAQIACPQAGQTCIQLGTTFTDANGITLTSYTKEGQCGSKSGDTTPLGQGATWLYKDNIAKRYCAFCPTGQYLHSTSQRCVECTSGHYCTGKDASGPQPCTRWDPSWLGKFWISEPCNATQDIKLSPCRVRQDGEFISSECTNTTDRKCMACDTCRINRASPYHDFVNYIISPCTLYTDTRCGKCNASDKLVGGVCNPCPLGTRFSEGSCLLCRAGFFCNATSTNMSLATTSSRSLLAAAGRWLLDLTASSSPPSISEYTCPSGTISGPGADAAHCLPNCGVGFFSRDARIDNCAPAASPSLKRVAWYISGQDAIAAVQLGSPWDAFYAVGRNPSFSNTQAGELLMVGPDNQAFSLAGSPFTAANAPPVANAAATMGTTTRLGRIYGMAANPLKPVTQLVFSELIGNTSILRVADLAGVGSLSNPVTATLWSAGSAPSARSKLNRIAPNRVLAGYYFVADELAQCVWWVRLQTSATSWIPVSLSLGEGISLDTPTAVATDISPDRSIIYLAILDNNLLITCELSVEGAQMATTSITCALKWTCGGGHLVTSSDRPPTSCSALKITNGKSIDVALVPNSKGQMAYLLTTDARATENSGGAQRDGVVIINATVLPPTASWAVSLSSPTNFGQGAAFGMLTDFILTTGPTAWGASVQAMGLHGCLCAAGLYCLNGQCVATPAGTYSDDWATTPTRCPPGSAGDVIGATSLAEGCKLCSSDQHMTSYSWGSVNCIPKCNANTPVYSPTERACLPTCNISLGLYREELTAGSSCKPCPPGTQATAGIGIDACIACAVDEYYAVDRKGCLPCPSGTGTLLTASDVCMPLTQTPCDDGLLSLSGGICNSTTALPNVFGANITALYVTPSGVLFIGKSDGTVWRWSRKVTAAALPPPLPTIVTSYASPSVMFAVSADAQMLYSASKDATCVRWLDIKNSIENVIGNCGQAGILGNIVSMALIERPNFNPLLAVASRVTWKGNYCHAIFTISSYNQQIQALIHYDATTNPSVQLTECRSDAITLAASTSLSDSKLYLAWKDIINVFNLDTIGEVAQYPNQNQGVSAMSTTAAGGLLLAEKLSNNIDLIPTSNAASLRSIASKLPYNVSILAGTGNHIWYTQAGALQEAVSTTYPACAAGFAMINETSSCTQLGHGLYNVDGRSEQRCPPGTYGAVAGAGSKQEGCVACPIGTVSALEASIACTACPLGQVASTTGTTCLAKCATASYQNTTTSACIACPLGHTTTNPDARSANDCIPCPVGTYVNQNTNGVCVPCPSGQTSLAASHHCVALCSDAENTCSFDGQTCHSASNKYTMLTQIKTQDNPPYAIAVQNDGGVFYTDSVRVFYYLDTCPAGSQQCGTLSDALPIVTGAKCITSLAISDTASPTTTTSITPTVIRYLYYADAIEQTIRRLAVVYSGGTFNMTQTTSASSIIIAGQKEVKGSSDGLCLESTFNTIMDLEITQSNNGNTIFVLDSHNYRIRRIDIRDSGCTTTTIRMNGHTTWNEAVSVASAVPLYGFGLSTDETTLFIAFPTQHKVLSLNVNTGTLMSICEMQVTNYNNDQPNIATSWCHAYGNNNVRPCMLRNVYDVVATDATHIYALFIQGVTQINFAASRPYESYGAQCTQVACVQNDFYSVKSTGFRDGFVLSGDSSLSSDIVNSMAAQMNVPFKVAYASATNIMYITDLNNYAIRRMYVNTDCTCAPGLVYIKNGRTCYNPNPNWNVAPLPVCTPGYYALNGETSCGHSCADVGITDDSNAIAAARACVQTLASNKPRAFIYNFNQILSSTTIHSADWYGYPQYQITTDFDSIPKSSTTKYHLGAAPGRAPSGGEFATLTWSVFAQEWQIEYDWRLQPTLIAPGMWYPCAEAIRTTSRSTYSCASSMFSFEQLSPDKPRFVAGKWESLRINAYEQGGTILTESITSLYNLTKAVDVDPQSKVNLFSRFYMFGSDSAVPSICKSSDGGPCFTTFRHVNTNNINIVNFNLVDETLEILPSYMAWAQAGCTRDHSICNASGYVGWPAHYGCPNGYMWIGPGLHTSTLQDLPTGSVNQIACISCLPGYFSKADAVKTDGGPYTCTACEPGSYASSVGSSTCVRCPTGTYSSATGSSVCTRCDNPKWPVSAQTTLWPGSYTVDQCIGCDPGTGSCGQCPAGGYQSNVGQVFCLPAPIGSMSPYPNASSAIPCPNRQYTDAVGQTTCKLCNGANKYTTSDIGATACATCMDQTCSLTVDNICGQGCGLNKYWNANSCVTCPIGTLNANYLCAKTVEACIATARGDVYLPPGTSTPQPCPPGNVASLDWTYCEACIPGSYSDGSNMTRQFSSGVAANATCHKCPPGTFGNASNMSSCYACAPGSYTSASGNTACDLCPQGKQCSTWGTVQPQACPPGTYGPTVGLTRCLLCANNTASNISGRVTQCDACNTDMGYYSPAPGGVQCRFCTGALTAGNCNPCGLGRYFQTECQLCPDGKVNLGDIWATEASICQRCSSPTAYASKTHDACIDADIGFMPNTDGTGQVPCAAGTYRQINMSTCTLCPPGSYADTSGSPTCSLCNAGFFMSEMGSTACTVCLPHTYSWRGAASCSVCAPGSEPNASVSCQLCTPNYYSSNGHRCSPCTQNQYAPIGSATCSYCQPPSVPGAGVCTICPPGKISITSSDGLYSTCERVNAPGFVCPNAGTTSIYNNCTKCSPPFTPNSNRTQCVLCGPGKTTDGGPCMPCPVGTFTADGRACAVCPAGTFSASTGTSQCAPCAAGRFRLFSNHSSNATACAHCPVGTYGNTTGLTSCASCINGWAGRTGQEECTPRNLSCPTGQFVNRTTDPTRDNECVTCMPCSPNQFMYNTTARVPSILAVPSADILYTASYLCKGDGFAPGYTCLDPSNPKWALGYRIVIDAAGSSADSVHDGNSFAPCPDISPISFLVDYTPTNVCPTPMDCYVSCRYGLQSNAVWAYSSFMTSSLTLTADRPSANVFSLNNIQMLNKQQLLQICSPNCLTGTCNSVGYYRPQVQPAFHDLDTNLVMPACGAPCGIDGQCAGNNEGCSEQCTNLPPNASFITGAAGVGNSTGCSWACNAGWHLNQDGTACDSCLQDNVASYCGSVNFALKMSSTDCTPMKRPSDLCVACERIEHAKPPVWVTGVGCQYTCYDGYFLTGNPPACTQCANNTLISACPVGTFLNVSACNTQQPPVCSNCTTPFTSRNHVQFLTNGGLDSRACRAVCNIWYHTRDNNVQQNLALSQWHIGVQTAYLECNLCTPNDSQTCGTLGCLKGHYRDVTIPDNQTGACKTCTVSSNCSAGYYANPCSGNTTADAPCVACPTLPYNRKHVAYGLMTSVVTGGDCPSTCINNYILNPSDGDCVPCAQAGCSMIAPADGQPPECAYRYSVWNAPPTVPWWNVDIMPTRLKQYNAYRQPRANNELWEAAGVCWPCPYGTNVEPGDTSLCVLMDGFGRQGSLPLTTTSIPVLTSEMIAVFSKEPRPRLAVRSTRRLLSLPSRLYTTISLSQSPSSLRIRNTSTSLIAIKEGRRSLLTMTDAASASAMPAACPKGSFKPSRGEALCQLCPSGRSTSSTQSNSIASCQCLPGHEPVANSSICLPCPIDKFLSTQTGTCEPCPVNQTTWGNLASSRCSCVRGFYRVTDSQCAPCPAGSYCVTCLDSDALCPSTGVNMFSCFTGATSAPASYSLDACVCLNSMDRVLIAPRYYACRALPFGARVIQGRIVCNDGWITNGTQANGDISCILCGPGSFALPMDPSSTQPQIPVSCSPCPLNSFASSSVTVGSCTPCPSQQFTVVRGASSMDQCLCPDGQTKSKLGTCIGCTSSQYFSNISKQCLPCPMHTIAPKGATAVEHCQCMLGYARSSSLPSTTCDICPTGTYYISPSAPCQQCPPGSTTAGPGSIDRSACGRTSDLCANGYVYRNTGGCYAINI